MIDSDTESMLKVLGRLGEKMSEQKRLTPKYFPHSVDIYFNYSKDCGNVAWMQKYDLTMAYYCKLVQ